MRGYFVHIEEKLGGEIVKSPPINYEPLRGIEYINKIEFYLPQMLPMLEGEKEPEDYPRRTLYAFNCPCGMCDYAGLCLHGDIMGLTIDVELVGKATDKNAIFLSPTQLIRYETCPRQWAYYVAGYRTEISSAKLQFGDSIHSAIEAYIRLGEKPKESFLFFWGEYKDASLRYSRKDTNHEYFQKVGVSLMEKFPDFYTREIISELKISEIQAETLNAKRLNLSKDYFGRPVYLVCKPDLICKTNDGETIVIDWKVTTKKAFDWNWLSVSDQMTGYFLFLS